MAGLITLLIVLAFALYVCWLMLQPFVNVLLWAVVLTVVFYPMHQRIRARLAAPSAAAAASTLLVIVLILLPVSFITVAVVRELSGAAASSRTRRSSCPTRRRRWGGSWSVSNPTCTWTAKPPASS